MSRYFAFLVALLLIVQLLDASGARAAILNVFSGRLMGALGVDVGGTLYDVEFLDGSCSELFDGCVNGSSEADFTFTTSGDALLAAESLLDQVFIDSGLGAFDSTPWLTNGCDDLNDSCLTLTPYALSGFSGVTNSLAPNSSTLVEERSPYLGGVQRTIQCGDPPRCTYAVWSLSTLSDVDADGVLDPLDNCPTVSNATQDDTDLDRIGDVCDPFPSDPCNSIGALPQSTPSLAAFQDNSFENWSGVAQPGDNLQSAVLTEANLRFANLNGALLINATFVGACLDSASLFNTNLTNADLQSATLTNTDMTFADLSGVTLSEANMTSADLSSANLSAALYNEFTVFPSGDTYYSGVWGLPNGAAPWTLGMIWTPEPSFGLMLLFGAGGLAGLASRRR